MPDAIAACNMAGSCDNILFQLPIVVKKGAVLFMKDLTFQPLFKTYFIRCFQSVLVRVLCSSGVCVCVCACASVLKEFILCSGLALFETGIG
jgi:hypothetical protein